MASGIADYSAELLPFVAEEAEVEAFCPAARRGRVVRAPAGIPVLHPRTFGERGHRYDAVFYHLGNNPFHAFVYRASLRWPGVAVLHEVVLHHLIENMLLPDRSSDLIEYGQLLVAEYGPLIASNLAIYDGLGGCGVQLLADKTKGAGRYTPLANVLADDQLYVNAASGTWISLRKALVNA